MEVTISSSHGGDLFCAGQDVKDSLDDEPLKACVASGNISYVRKIANEQDSLKDIEQLREATPPASDDAAGGSCQSSEDGVALDRDTADTAEPQPVNGAFHDDVDCLEIEL